MTDLTPTLNTLLPKAPIRSRAPTPETADEFLKEAYRINSHITSLIKYLTSIRKPYLTPTPATYRRKPAPTAASASHASSSAATQKHPDNNNNNNNNNDTLTDPDRDAIDSSTSVLLHDLSSSLTNLSSAESLRQETHASQLRARYGRGRAGRILFRWAGGKSALPDGPGHEDEDGGGKSGEQLRDEETARVTRAVRESVLWFLRRALEGAVVRQRELVERRIERARERERSVLYKSAQRQESGAGGGRPEESMPSTTTAGDPAITEAESKEIESQLSPEQLQLFAEENDSMLRYYQDTLGKVQNAEKSLLEISSLQQSLVSHLAAQEDYIGQLVTDAAATQTNIGGGNRELRRATEKRSTAQAVFWGTVGVCTWLVVWDLIF